MNSTDEAKYVRADIYDSLVVRNRELEAALRGAIRSIEWLADQQAMTDNGYLPELLAARAVLIDKTEETGEAGKTPST